MSGAHHLKPQAADFKRSTDPAFAAKAEDVLALCVHPPDHALVLCIEEKTQIQALDQLFT